MKLRELNRLEQAVWLDSICRAFIASGELQDMVNAGVRGVTSNPTIFEKTIAGSADYDEELLRLVQEGRSDEEISQALTVEDIRRAADIFLPLFTKTGGGDGYVSIEVSPLLAHDTDGTVAEGRRLFAAVNRPNVLIKVPATPAGVRATPVLIGEGIHVHVTLIFSVAQYEPVAEAYRKGLEILSESGGDVGRVASVASFIVSRVDAAVDAEFENLGINRPIAKIAVGNVRLAYARFRKTFLNDPNIGGRYSALSFFGLVPAALIGVDLSALLDRAMTAVCNSEGCNCPVGGDNLGARLGIILGELSAAGRDKLTLIASPAIGEFGNWVEQLIAESTGKEGKGIVPVVGEPTGPAAVYGKDRLFVYLRLEGDDSLDGAVQDLENAGHPVVRLRLKDPYDLGGQFFLWEMATAVAGHRIGINPFDQPNVESAKILARRMLDDYRKEGKLPGLVPTLRSGGITVYGDVAAGTPTDMLIAFLGRARLGDYVALQAYVHPCAGMDQALLTLRSFLRDRYKLATTVGYGPRWNNRYVDHVPISEADALLANDGRSWRISS